MTQTRKKSCIPVSSPYADVFKAQISPHSYMKVNGAKAKTDEYSYRIQTFRRINIYIINISYLGLTFNHI